MGTGFGTKLGKNWLKPLNTDRAVLIWGYDMILEITSALSNTSNPEFLRCSRKSSENFNISTNPICHIIYEFSFPQRLVDIYTNEGGNQFEIIL